jgi:hypothetical protein
LTEEDLEEITKEWSADLLIAANPVDISDITSPKAAQDTPGPSKTQKTTKTKKTKETNKTKEVQDVDSRSVRIASITLDEEGNDEDLEEVEQQPEYEVEVLKKRKGSPSNYFVKKKAKATSDQDKDHAQSR